MEIPALSKKIAFCNHHLTLLPAVACLFLKYPVTYWPLQTVEPIQLGRSSFKRGLSVRGKDPSISACPVGRHYRTGVNALPISPGRSLRLCDKKTLIDPIAHLKKILKFPFAPEYVTYL